MEEFKGVMRVHLKDGEHLDSLPLDLTQKRLNDLKKMIQEDYLKADSVDFNVDFDTHSEWVCVPRDSINYISVELLAPTPPEE